MKIAVIGATGMAGSRVVAEALRRGHDVTAAFRSPVAITGVRAVRGDATNRKLLSGVDSAVTATRTRILVVGGAAPLRSPDGPHLVLDDSRYVPQHIRPVAAASLRPGRAAHRPVRRVPDLGGGPGRRGARRTRGTGIGPALHGRVLRSSFRMISPSSSTSPVGTKP